MASSSAFLTAVDSVVSGKEHGDCQAADCRIVNNYGFSKKFGWVNDRFGVSWQINLPM
nr:VOC family protein [Neobacillus sp. 114]